MRTFDARSAEVLVLTFKEGLLSAVAHDLKLRVTRFQIDVDETTRAVQATFDPASLEVVSAMKDGVENRGALSDKDRRDILDNTAKDVLEPHRHREIRFTSRSVERAGDGWRVAGTLAIKGRERPVSLEARRRDDRLTAEVRLLQPDFGIKPFSALFGALKIKPEVVVRVSLPASAGKD